MLPRDIRESITRRKRKESGILLLILMLVLMLSVLSGCGSSKKDQADTADNRGKQVDESIQQAREAALPEGPEISGETYPTTLSNGQSFGLRGNIICRYPMTRIRGMVTNRITGETVFDISVTPNATSYSIGNPTSETINDRLEFNNPRCSNSYLNYQLSVEYEKDGKTCTKVLLDQDFKVGTPPGEAPEKTGGGG